MIYRHKTTRPGGQPGNLVTQENLYFQAFSNFEAAPTRVYLRERTSNLRQLWHDFATRMFAFRSPFVGGAI